MKIRKSLKIEKAVSNDDMRGAMQHISISDGLVVATNGHILAVVECENTPEENGLLSTKALIESRKIKKYQDCNSEILSKFEETILLDDIKDFSYINLNGAEQLLNGAAYTREKDARFPDWKSVIPEQPADYTISFNAKLLYDLAQALGSDNVVLEMTGLTRAIRVYCGANDEGNNNFGLLMPTRIDSDKWDYKAPKLTSKIK